MKTKILARLLLPFFSLWLAVMPARSYAIVPVLLAPLVSGLTFGGALTALDTIGLGIAVTGLTYIAANNMPAMKLSTDNVTPLDTPQGWNAPVAPSVSPTAPATTTPQQTFGGKSFSEWDSICTSSPVAPGYLGTNGTLHYLAPDLISCEQQNATYNNWVWLATSFPNQHLIYSCPAGYSLNGSICNLVNNAQVQKPAGTPCEITRTGNTFTADPNNPDCVNTPARVMADKGTATVTNNTVNISNTDGRKSTIVINSDGSTTITSSVPDLSSKTTTTTTTVLSPPDSAGKTVVIGQQSLTTSGTGALTTNTPVSGGTTAPPIVFPTDYNREATQADIAKAVTVTASVPIADNELQDITNLTGDSGNILPKFDRNALNGKIDLPSDSAATCQPMQLNFLGRPLVVDICPAVTFLHPLVNYLFIFLFGILCFKTAFKNDELN